MVISQKTLYLHQKIESELRQLQLKCLEILDIVVKICTEHNIKYSLCGGSVVGAHLYKGFLPWDDDIDIMMTRENYNRFITIAENKLFFIENIYLQDQPWLYSLVSHIDSMLLLPNTTYIMKKHQTVPATEL